MRRTHTCRRTARKSHRPVGRSQRLGQHYRNQGALVFIDVRDRYGITQVCSSRISPNWSAPPKSCAANS